MVMKIYTRTGDAGETGLFGGERVQKDHIRVDAYGEVDELNAVLGLVIDTAKAGGDAELAPRLRAIQADLFSIGAHLATPGAAEGARAASHLPDLPVDRVAEMEGWIDAADAELPTLKSFVLPGGSAAAAWLHLARTVCRRAERRVVSLGRESPVPEEIVVYLNRLSDLLFTLARLANHRTGVDDVPWRPDRRE